MKYRTIILNNDLTKFVAIDTTKGKCHTKVLPSINSDSTDFAGKVSEMLNSILQTTPDFHLYQTGSNITMLPNGGTNIRSWYDGYCVIDNTTVEMTELPEGYEWLYVSVDMNWLVSEEQNLVRECISLASYNR